ncbi:MAG TPA: hypothetical protein VFZ73_03005 [Gemmatimonadaceae bacterium]
MQPAAPVVLERLLAPILAHRRASGAQPEHRAIVQAKRHAAVLGENDVLHRATVACADVDGEGTVADRDVQGTDAPVEDAVDFLDLHPGFRPATRHDGR